MAISSGFPVGNAALFTVDSAGVSTAVGSSTPLPTTSGAATAANVLTGFQSFTSTTAATTVVTIPAGRTWVGTVGVSCAVSIAAASSTAGQARAVVTVAGTGVTPAAGTILAAEAKVGANAATGTVGGSESRSATSPFTVIAPAGNSVTIQVASTNAGTASVVDCWATGALV